MALIDDYVFGYGQSGQEYVVRTIRPRFIANINAVDLDPFDYDEKLIVADDDDGTQQIFYITKANHVISDFVWYDTPKDVAQIMEVLTAMETELEIVEMDDKEGHFLAQFDDEE